jgi:hypothetical protein
MSHVAAGEHLVSGPFHFHVWSLENVDHWTKSSSIGPHFIVFCLWWKHTSSRSSVEYIDFCLLWYDYFETFDLYRSFSYKPVMTAFALTFYWWWKVTFSIKIGSGLSIRLPIGLLNLSDKSCRSLVSRSCRIRYLDSWWFSWYLWTCCRSLTWGFLKSFNWRSWHGSCWLIGWVWHPTL